MGLLRDIEHLLIDKIALWSASILQQGPIGVLSSKNCTKSTGVYFVLLVDDKSHNLERVLKIASTGYSCLRTLAPTV